MPKQTSHAGQGPSIFYDNKSMKLEIDNKKKSGKFTNVQKLNYTFLNNQ